MPIRTFKDNSVFENRRKRLAQFGENAVYVFFSGEESHLARFRAESSFVYFTGFEEPSSVAVIRTGEQESYSLFVREKDPSVEIWDGERFGQELAKKEFGVDQCFGMGELDEQLPHLLRGAEKLYFAIGEDSARDAIIFDARDRAQQLDRRSGRNKLPIFDPKEVVAPMRVIKDEHEITWLTDACRLSAQAHVNVMKNVKPGMNERQAQAHLFFSFYNQEASFEGYSSIIASGANACTLHYRDNNRLMQDGDFLLIDAGAEKNYYTADITRTYPVNGKFTSAQKDIYQAVLDVQKELIALSKPGYSIPEMHQRSCELLVEKMIDLGLLKGSVDEIIENKTYLKYYPHGIGHYLGMDVHDVGFSKNGNDPVPFQPNMVHTIEPGLYVPVTDDSAPKELRGLGVRIEDDILISEKGPVNLTQDVPKEVEELESIIGEQAT